MKKGLYTVLILILVVLFCGSAIYLGGYFLAGKREEERYKELATQVEEAQQTEAPIVEATEDPVKKLPQHLQQYGFLPGYKALFEQNEDMVGWLKIDGSPIDYPVMQTNLDNLNYYLYRNFDRQDSARGSIYVREQCDVFLPSDNVTIYGHNMRDGSMFAYLGNYVDKDFWKDNSLICFDTLFENHVYKIFAVFKTSANEGEGFAYHRMEEAVDEEDFNAFISECKGLAFYDTGITPVYGDKIICLSTCEYTYDNGRFVVAAVRIT